MNSNLSNSTILGILFILPLFFYGIGDHFIMSNLFGDAAEKSISHIRWGAILVAANSITVIFIGIFLYPIIRKSRPNLALTYFSARLVEGVLLLVGLVALLSLSQVEVDTAFVALVPFGQSIQFYAFQLAMIALGMGSIFFCFWMLREKWVPRFLSIWGILGYAMLAIGGVFEIFGYSIGIMLSIPGGLFELCFGVWLMYRGIRSSTASTIAQPTFS